MSYDALFSPIKLRGLELKNRVVLPGMNTKMVKDKHNVGEDLPAYHAARAAGGCGLNIVELVSICPECHAYLYLGLYNEHHRDQLRKITDAIHAAGGKAGVQIWHGGFVPEEFFDKTNKLETPDTLTVERIHEIVKQFGYSAKLAVEAGFDALEFHGAHTYLPHEFMNPSLNKRTDEFGGSFENRCRFNLEVIREMRKNMPEDMPLLMRLDAIDEMLPAVTTQDETVQFINWAAEAGVDAIDLSRGNARSLATVYEVPPYNLEPGFNMDNIAAIKARVNIPVIGVGRIVDPALADQLIREGKIDMVAVGRAQQVAEHHRIALVDGRTLGIAHILDRIGHTRSGPGVGAVRLADILEELLLVGARLLGQRIVDIAQEEGLRLVGRQPRLAAEVVADTLAYGLDVERRVHPHQVHPHVHADDIGHRVEVVVQLHAAALVFRAGGQSKRRQCNH